MDYGPDLKRAFEVLSRKRERHDEAFRYYDGEQTVSLSTQALREAFKNIDVHFPENWCAPVVDLLLDRLDLSGFKSDGATQAAVDALWSDQQLDIETDEATADVAICGESYVIVGKDADGVTDIYHNDPRMCHLFYDEANPRKKAVGAKWWKATDERGVERRHIMLYYPDVFAHFVSSGKATDALNEKAFSLESEDANESGAIGVFHLRTRKRKEYGELKNAIPVQRAINRLSDDMMVAAEYSAFKQRWAITVAKAKDLKASPGTMMTFPPAETGEQGVTVGEFTATELANYIGAIEHKANAMATGTRTPRSAFFAIGAGISGDALIAMEAQLGHKAKHYQKRLSPEWCEIVAYALSLDGVMVDPVKIEAAWQQERTVQPLSEAQALASMVAATVPLKTALRWLGHDETDIAQLEKDIAADTTGKASLAQAALAAARAKFNAGPPMPTTGQQQGMPGTTPGNGKAPTPAVTP